MKYWKCNCPPGNFLERNDINFEGVRECSKCKTYRPYYNPVDLDKKDLTLGKWLTVKETKKYLSYGNYNTPPKGISRISIPLLTEKLISNKIIYTSEHDFRHLKKGSKSPRIPLGLCKIFWLNEYYGVGFSRITPYTEEVPGIGMEYFQVEICKHNYEQSDISSRTFICTKCGYSIYIDSSD